MVRQSYHLMIEPLTRHREMIGAIQNKCTLFTQVEGEKLVCSQQIHHQLMLLIVSEQNSLNQPFDKTRIEHFMQRCEAVTSSLAGDNTPCCNTLDNPTSGASSSICIAILFEYTTDYFLTTE